MSDCENCKKLKAENAELRKWMLWAGDKMSEMLEYIMLRSKAGVRRGRK